MNKEGDTRLSKNKPYILNKIIFFRRCAYEKKIFVFIFSQFTKFWIRYKRTDLQW